MAMTCSDASVRLAAYVDGGLPADARTHLDDHLTACAACRRDLARQTEVRDLLGAAGRQTAAMPPPWLHTRIAARLAAEAAPASRPGWRTRVTAFAAAALVVLAVSAAALPVVTGRSTVVLAAQLALDHLKCFVIDGEADGGVLDVAEAEAELRDAYGWNLHVPATAGDADAQLMAVRRCLYGDGRAAHLLYRWHGAPVSLFILPGLERPDATLTVFGHEAVVWTGAGRTYVLVGAAASRDQLSRMATTLRNEAE
ncbi:MAG: zf-HC2 domain-containing protein [Vicinamibacterales bacterium]